MDFRSIRLFSTKKVDNTANFAAGGIINRRTQHNSVETKQEQVIRYGWFTRQ
jgi:hypothetical protein